MASQTPLAMPLLTTLFFYSVLLIGCSAANSDGEQKANIGSLFIFFSYNYYNYLEMWWSGGYVLLTKELNPHLSLIGKRWLALFVSFERRDISKIRFYAFNSFDKNSSSSTHIHPFSYHMKHAAILVWSNYFFYSLLVFCLSNYGPRLLDWRTSYELIWDHPIQLFQLGKIVILILQVDIF